MASLDYLSIPKLFIYEKFSYYSVAGYPDYLQRR